MHTFSRLDTPLITTTRDCTFGLNMRFVRRLEKLTLRPNWVVLPQTSHLPATVRFLHDMRSMRKHHQNATPRAFGKHPTWQGNNLRATLNHTMFLSATARHGRSWRQEALDFHVCPSPRLRDAE